MAEGFGGAGGDDKIEIKLVVDSAGAVRAFDQFGKEVLKVEQSAKKAEGSFTRLQAKIISIDSAINLAMRAWRMMNKLMDRADAIQDVSAAFEQFSRAVGQDSTKALNQLRASTGGLITNLDLMKAATKAITLGVEDGSGAFAEMAGNAVKMGKAMGVDAKQAVDVLTKGIAAQRDGIFRQIGLQIDLTGALKDCNTEEEKRVKTIKLVQEQLEKQAAILGGDGGISLPDAWTKLKVSATNAVDEIIKSMSGSNGLADALSRVADWIAKLDLSYTNLLKHGAYANAYLEMQAKKQLAHATSRIAGWTDWLFGPSGGRVLSDAEIEAEFQTKISQINAVIQRETAAEVAKTGPAIQKMIFGADTGGGGAGGAAGKTSFDAQAMEQVADDFVSDIWGGMEDSAELKEGAGDFADAMMEELASGLQSALTSGDFRSAFQSSMTSIGGMVGQGIGAEVGGPIGAAIGQGIMTAWFDYLAKGISQIGTTGKNSVKGLGNVVDIFFPGVGTLAGTIAENIFGGGNADTESRKAVDRWFADLLDPARLKLVIGGQLQELRDLTFEGNYEAVPAPGFGGVGAGIAAMLGETGIKAQQLASVLSENLGGSLNNLQIMIEALGLSFEDMQKALEEAFLIGDVSAKDFLSSMAELNDVMTQGIPGAVGAVDEAFNNLVEGGLASGRIAMDAFGDLAAEAIEAGASSMEDLRARLIELGVPLDKIDQLFQAFAQNGIDSLDELANIGVTGTAQLISSLEDIGFAFEAPVEGADELYERLEEITSRDWEAHVKVIYEEEGEPPAGESVVPTSGAAPVAAGGGGIVNSAMRRGFAPIAMASVMGPKRSYNLARISAKYGGGEDAADFLNSVLRTSMGMSGDPAQNFRQVARVMSQIDDLQARINKRFEEGGKFPEKMVEGLIRLNAKLDEMGQKAATPEEVIAQTTAAVLAGTMDIGTAAAIIASNKAVSGGGLPGFGDITGAASALFAGGSGANQMADWKNLMTEAEEGGYGSSEFANILREKFGSKADSLIQFLSGKGLNTLDAMLNIDDSALVELLAAAEKGLVIPVSFATPEQTPGQGGGRRTRVNSQGITQVWSKRRNKWVPARHQPL